MITADSITIKEFRGIRDLTLDFNGKSFAICGPNGTGKSGVVDALEFALTGNVSRLSGEGSRDISLKQHGPHVDKRNDPAKARVAIQVSFPGLSKTATIERNLKNPSDALVIPADPAILEILQHVKAHPEIVLSRRELIRYVLATPGDRAKEVQALLQLDQVEKVRFSFQKIANNSEKQLPPLASVASQARDNLLRAIGIPDLSKEKVLASANAQRAILSLPPLADLSEAISLKDGMAASPSSAPQRIPKAQALADIRAALGALADISSASTATCAAEAAAVLTALAADPALEASAKRESFYTAGLALIGPDGACPLCDTPWDLASIKILLQAKIDHLHAIVHKRKAAETKISPLAAALRKVQAIINTIAGHAALAAPPVAFNAPREYAVWCGAAAERIAAFFPLSETLTVLARLPAVPQPVLDAIGALDKAVGALPEPSKQDAAREWLIIAQERLGVWREAARKHSAVKEQARLARQISDIYAATSDKVLTSIYAAVEKDFSALYSFVNRDEDAFKAQLTPSLGKLGFDVDFYGRGFFPPGAYHSEGHQDSMGLCLYLALMRHLHGAKFTFAVLDDVLMSVDSGHRRQACALLKREFPATQFIMTTHDPIWFRHMKAEGIITGASSIQFRNWSVAQGPTLWEARDVWTEIDDYLRVNDVRSAAALLRHFLEHDAAELCHRLRARVEFRADAQYQLGELLPPAISRMRDLYALSKKAANSWNQKEVVALLAAQESEFSKLASASNAEQWQVNAAVHFNSWATLSKDDFSPVSNAFRALLQAFTCTDCGEYLHVTPDRETPESFRCGCGKISNNLCEKSS